MGSTNNEWLQHFLFIHTRKTQPDGRALYAYKCTKGKYEELHGLILKHFGQALQDRQPKLFDALFCLYAAETWRRNHEGGVWRWETVFQVVNQTTPHPQNIIYDWVENGLRYWQRPLIRSPQGREFLLTIACEGGLPLKLLQRESDSLNQYFRELLVEQQRQQHNPKFDLIFFARQSAVLRLPKSLHQEIVYRLSGELIQAIVNLQAKVCDADDPITALDKADKDWRKTLPLSLEDDTIEVLLHRLIRKAKDLAHVGLQHLRWRRRLIEKGQSWNLESYLELPDNVTGAALRGWTNRDKHLPRLRLFAQNSTGKETVARLTKTQGEGDSARYRLERLRPNGIRLVGPEAVTLPSLWLSNGDAETELPARGAVELGELPWLFVARGDEKEWLAEGSGRTKESRAWVLAPDKSVFHVMEGTCEIQGNTPQLQRTLYAIQGTVRFNLPSGESCLFQCSAEAESEEEWLLEGKTLDVALNPCPIFLGMPKLAALNAEGKRIAGRSGLLEWRPVNAPNANWSKDFLVCTGTVWLRGLDPNTQSLVFRRQANVLPASARVEIIKIGSHTEPGRIQLSGLKNASCYLPPQPDCTITLEQQGDTQEILCFADSQLQLTQFPLELCWPGCQKLTLILPFPCEGAAFVQGGQVIGKGQTIALGRLGAITAVAQSPNNGKFWLEATVKSDEVSSIQRKLWLRETLKTIETGRAIFDLHRWQERLSSLLSMTCKLDATACLEIHTLNGTVITKLDVARFDVEFIPDKDYRRVILPAGQVNCLEEDWQNRVTVKMIPLWNPSEKARELLKMCDEDLTAWQVPDDLRPGPWWILGCDGDWARFRPLLWVIPGEGETITDASTLNSSLAQAICSDNESRPQRMIELVKTLAHDPAHSDWPQVFEYFKLAQSYPASALNLLPALARSPEAMALALILSSEDQFESVWSLAYQLPFSWHLLPIRSWRAAIERYFDWLRIVLKDVDTEGSMLLGIFEKFRQRVVSRQAFFTPLCDWIQKSLFPQSIINGSELGLARTLPSFFEEKIKSSEQDLQGRRIQDEKWTPGPTVLQMAALPDFPENRRYLNLNTSYRAVRCAPFVAARFSLQGLRQAEQYTGAGAWFANYIGLQTNACSEELLFELRQLRDFDREWFDEVFAIALCLGLAQFTNTGNLQ